ncbi:MFS transporter [bacterium CPR1]|nr:MFS transporter [bacterium CPR1]
MQQLALLTERKFWPLFWTQFLGAFNDSFLKNALVIWITYRSVSVLGLDHQMMAVLSSGIFILPYFLFSATAGQLADKYDKAFLVRWIKTIEIGLMGLATMGFLLAGQGNQAGIVLLLVTIFLMGAHSTFFGPIKYSILPQLVGHEARLVGANALVEMATNLAILTGTLLGGVLIALAQGPVVVSLALLGIALLGRLASHFLGATVPAVPDLAVELNPVPPTVRILAFVYPQRAIWLSILGNSWFWLYGSVFLALFPSYGKDTLHAEEHVVTLFLTIFSVGVGIGSILCEKVSFDRLELGLVPFGSIGMTVFGVDLFFAGAPTAGLAGSDQLVSLEQFLALPACWRIMVDLFGLSLFSGLFIVPLYTLMQQRSADSHRSRVIAANNIVNAAFMVTQTLVVMALLHLQFTIPQIFLLLGILNALVAAYIYTLLPEFFLRFCVYLLAHLIYRLKCYSVGKIPREGPAVLVCNHVTFIDWFLIAADVRRPVRFVMDLSYARMPFLRAIFRDAKVIPIASAKRDPEVLERAFERISEELAAGELVCIFPEGRLTDDGKLSEFRPGVERIIERNRVPVVPMALGGLWGSFFSRKGGRALSRFRGLWSRVTLVVGDPVPPEEVSARSLQVIVQELAHQAEDKLRSG